MLLFPVMYSHFLFILSKLPDGAQEGTNKIAQRI